MARSSRNYNFISTDKPMLAARFGSDTIGKEESLMIQKKHFPNTTSGELPKPEFPIDSYPEEIVILDGEAIDQIHHEYRFLKEKYPPSGKPRKVTASHFPPSLVVPEPGKWKSQDSRITTEEMAAELMNAQRALGNSRLAFAFPPFGGYPNDPIYIPGNVEFNSGQPFAFGELTHHQWASKIHLSGHTNAVDEALSIPGFPRSYYPLRRWPEIHPIVQLREPGDVAKKIIWSRLLLDYFRAPDHPSGFSNLRFQVPYEVTGYTWASTDSYPPDGFGWAFLTLRLEVIHSLVRDGKTVQALSSRTWSVMEPRIERPGAYRISLIDSGIWVETVGQLEHSVRALSDHYVSVYLVTELTLAVSPESTLSMGGDFAERFPRAGGRDNSINVRLLATSYTGTPAINEPYPPVDKVR